jgi:DNA-3-methyladenine glycosylase II
MSDITIPKPQNFSFKECLWFLDRNYDDCLYRVMDHSVIKPLTIDGLKVIFELTELGGSLHATLLYKESDRDMSDEIRGYVNDWLDLERDLSGFYTLLQGHKAFHYMPDEFSGLRLIGIPDVFEAICWCIIGQQINLTFAYKLKRRMVEEYGESVEVDGQPHHFFPRPEILAEATMEDLKALQFSRQKADYVIHVAKLISSGEFSKQELQALPDREAQLKRLISVRGIGEWTANYVLMKTLKDMNCITIGDTGLNSALDAHGLVKNKKDKAEVRAFFEAFEGWKSYLVIYLWRSLTSPNIDV